MKRREIGTFVAGVLLAGAVVGGAMAFDTDAPTKSAGYADPGSPVACADATCGTPVALPTVAATVEPTATVLIDTLPATGTGPNR